MDKEKIISYFTSGKIPAGVEVKAPLHDIVHTFPYFQLAQVLYAKQMYDDNDADTATRVKLASVYAPNRKAMYLLFRKPAEPVVTSTSDIKIVTEPVVKIEPKVEVKPEVKVETKPIEVVIPVVKVEPKVEIKEEVKPEIKVESKVEPAQTEASRAKVQVEAKELDSTMENEASFTFVQTTTEPVKEEPKPTEAFVASLPQLEEETKKKATDSAVSDTFLEKEILSNIAAKQAEIEVTHIPPVEEVKEAKTEEKAVVAPIEAESPVNLYRPHSFEDWLKILPSAKTTDIEKVTSHSEVKSNDIVERFLANEPRISKPKVEFFSPSKAAKLSVSDDDELVSETLAKIYVAQGNLYKALRAYDSLMLQNPEKSTYFAARIKEIRDILESQKNK